MEHLLNVQEAAQLLGLRPPTLYKMVCLRRIPYVKLGRRLLFNPEKLRQWVHENSREPALHIIP